MSELLSVDLALQKILSQIPTLSTERIPFTDALGRVLAEDIASEINLPPFPNSSMDGYALRAEDTIDASQAAPIRLKVTTDIRAGTAPTRDVDPGEAARIMTGAPIPPGANAVIPVEQTNGRWDPTGSLPPDTEVAVYSTVKPGDNIRPVGEDIQAGQIVLKTGAVVGPAEIGVLAALGQSQVAVIRRPRVIILGTGDELVDVDQPLAPGKIRDTNSYTLAALVANCDGQPIRLPIARDSLDEVRSLFQSALAQNPDIIVSSAGVSVGAADLVRTVLDELGQISLWRINLRPGKPLAFGHLQGVPFFGLPGNPVSAMVTFDVFVRPALFKLMGKPDAVQLVDVVTQEHLSSDGRRSYLRVKINKSDGKLIARTTGTQSSGALSSMVLADGLMIIPEGVTQVKKGTTLQARLLRTLTD